MANEDRFDAIVVGGGVAGLAAAYTMAQAGLQVALIERGTTCGSKNVTGGKICSHSIEKLFPGFGKTPAVERKISKEKFFSWSGKGVADAGINPESFGLTETRSYSVIRAKLDSWLAEQAESAGVMLIQGIVVTDMIVRDGVVAGIVAGGDELEANVVILAEGINGLLARKLGMIPELLPEDTYVGTKEVIDLGENVINERFGLSSDEGAELMYLGDRSAKQYADGFIYTNKSSISVGIEFLISDIYDTEKNIPDMLEEFKNLPEISAYIEGGTLIEYSTHLVRKGAPDKLRKLYGDGVLLVGDTAELVANFGWVIRGMDMAVESGILAAEAVIRASESGDFSQAALASYQVSIENSFIASDMAICREYHNKK